MSKHEELLKMINEIKETISVKTTAEIEEIVSKVKEEFEEKLKEVAQKAPLVGDEPAINSDILSIKSDRHEVVKYQEIWDKALMAAQLTGKDPFQTSVWKHLEKEYPVETKQLASTLTGQGAELTPVGYSRRLWDELMLKLAVAGLHEVVNMPTSPYKFPVAMVDAQAFYVPESASVNQDSADKIPATHFSTGEFTLDAKKIATRIPLSEELQEDSLIDVIPLVQRRVIDAVKIAIENAIINGDSAATHMDADVTATTDPRKAFDGYRKVASGNAVDFAGSLDSDKILALKAAMDKYGVVPDDVAFVVAPATYFKMLALKDSAGNPIVTTRDKYGNQATIITGELGKVFGSPVIVSPYVRTDLNASGVYDGVTTNLTIMLAVHAPSFVIGNRRDLQVRIVRYGDFDQTSVSAWTRIAFGTPWVGRPVAAVGVNIA